jgi:RNA polymerase sigma-70 factor (ECF subfamily)
MPRPDRRSDGDLLVAARADRAAFGVFYDRHVRGVFTFFRRRAGGADLAMDLTAETFAAVLQALPRYEPRPEPARGWLYGIAWNKLLDAQRAGRAEDRVRRELGMLALVLSDDGLARIEALGDRAALDLLEALPREQRDAVRARHIEERDYGEIAAELQCSESVVRQRVSRGLRTLREQLRGGKAIS